MKPITIENASLTMTLDNVGYEFPFVTNITLTDPRENQMTVSPQGKGEGVVYRINTTAPCANDFIIRDVPIAIFNAMKVAQDTQARIDFLLYDVKTGNTYQLNKSIIRTNPSNTTITEGESSTDVALTTNCPPNYWKHIPPTED